VAGTLSSDPDGNGDTELPHRTRVIFNPWGYRLALDSAGSHLPFGEDYVRKMVGSVLEDCFGQLPDAERMRRLRSRPSRAWTGNFPDPFNPKTTIRFSLSVAQARESLHLRPLRPPVAELVDEALPAGTYQVEWNGRDAGGARAASGVYFAKMNAAPTARREDAAAEVTGRSEASSVRS